MASAEHNELMTRTNPGTPAGTLLRQYWQSAPNDFAAYLNLGRRLAQDGAEDELTKLRPAGTRFPSRQRSFAEIVFLVETNKSLLAFQRLRRHARPPRALRGGRGPHPRRLLR